MLAALLVLACGESTSDSTHPTDASADAVSDTTLPGKCQSDEDCPAERPACADYFGCSQCRAGGNYCPAERPICLPDWEGNGLYCAECAIGSSVGVCPDGQWCTPFSEFQLGHDGECTPANCATSPSSLSCQACAWENSAPCFEPGGSCEGPLQALCQCLENNGQQCISTPTKRTLAISIPTACHDAAANVSACVVTCPEALAKCTPTTDGGA